MKTYLVKTPKLVQRSYPKRIWAFPNEVDSIFLTFDDGPIPEVTPWVLDLLREHNAKASFFCIGDNIARHPQLFKRIISEGHSVGNHTFNHLNGRKTSTSKYLENVELASTEMEKHLGVGSRKSEVGSQQPTDEIVIRNSSLVNPLFLFRPPYGRITSEQARFLQNKNYKLIMWDVLSYDFDATVSEEKCLENVISNIEAGSIVVFHDSIKAQKNLRYTLPKVLEFASANNYRFKAISNSLR